MGVGPLLAVRMGATTFVASDRARETKATIGQAREEPCRTGAIVRYGQVVPIRAKEQVTGPITTTGLPTELSGGTGLLAEAQRKDRPVVGFARQIEFTARMDHHK